MNKRLKIFRYCLITMETQKITLNTLNYKTESKSFDTKSVYFDFI